MTSDTNDQAPAANWNVFITRVVVIVGAGMVAVATDTSVTANAVPVGVLNSAVVSLTNGLILKLVVEFETTVHKILAVVPFLYSAGGARFTSMLFAI